MYKPPIFKDYQDMDYHYHVAKAIVDEIDYQVDMIEELKGHHMIDVTYITFNTKRRCIDIDTEFINKDGIRYSWNESLKIYSPFVDFMGKVICCWFRDGFQKGYEHGIYFNGNP